MKAMQCIEESKQLSFRTARQLPDSPLN